LVRTYYGIRAVFLCVV